MPGEVQHVPVLQQDAAGGHGQPVDPDAAPAEHVVEDPVAPVVAGQDGLDAAHLGQIQPEISDDEARAVSVKSILIKTYSMTNTGTRIEFTRQQKDEAYGRAQDALAKIRAGSDFDVVAADYNEDSESSYSFARGVMPQAFEDAAFNLDNGEVSEIIETEYGYHILMCTSSFDRDETDANKAGIVKKRQQEEFNRIYDEYVQGLTTNLNAELWESVEYKKSPSVNTTSFFEVYDSYF